MSADRPASGGVSPTARTRRRPAVLTALAVLLLVLVGGGVFWGLERPQYRATATLVVLPAADVPQAASYYDTLSQGQITKTFAQVLGLAATPAPGSAGSGATVTVDVVTGTSLIQVTATAPAARQAESAADAALGQARPQFDQLGAPYRVSVVRAAGGTAQRAGLTLAVLAGVVVAVALIAAVASYFAVRALQQSRLQASLVDARVRARRPVAGTPAAADHQASPEAVVPPSGDGKPTAAKGLTKRAGEPLPPQPAQ